MADTASEQRAVSACTTVTTDTWKGQLDFGRACSGPEHRCWLCTELTPWNQAMHELAFELVEPRPGKLCLRSIRRDDGDIDIHPATLAKASFLVSWLLQHHRCIDKIKIACNVCSGFRKKEAPFPIRLRPASGTDSRRTIRDLEVQSDASSRYSDVVLARHSIYELEDLDAVGGLERLTLELLEVEPAVVAELARLLQRNASSIKSCESLTLSSRWCSHLPSMKPVARLLHSSTALKELSIDPVANVTQISAIAKELETNTSLAKLDLRMAGSQCPLAAVFTALQVNTTLRELSVADFHFSRECEQALSLLLQKNTGLRLLFIRDAYVTDSSLHMLAAALTRNTTLESLHLASKLHIDAIAEICKALLINKTLKKLQFTGFICPQASRADLARQLAQDDCYDRVKLVWTEPDLPGLTAALTSSVAGFEELRLPDICSLSEAGLKQLFDALASNECVRTLSINIRGDPGEKGTALCKMLKVNRSIECLYLAINEDTCSFVEEVFYALAENASITKVVLRMDVVCRLETGTALSYFLAHNKTANKFFVGFQTHLPAKFVDVFSQGMVHNKTIVKFGLLLNSYGINAGFQLYEAVRRNRGALNRAVDFVLSPSLDRRCAEGFELFAGTSCLLKQLKKVSGRTEKEALLAIAAAEHYLLDNFLLITGIVRHSLKCHPAEGTQVDALNKHCWQAIARHLKVADVIS
ncbi:hypothetical protein HPB48_023631 [Haemaphysalis longicornis]|uniref:Ran gtpase-activating protein n=1 Tax=Haemaphysalis longicornis TaxID=44386 RepID=A0A9J6H7G8_HAELO|nr:hypothetical protein HPB48_023631 [Haemaphysalis longicornis]